MKKHPEMTQARRKAVIYARVSSKEQEKEGYSIPAQLKLLNEYGFEKNLMVLKEFVDIETAKQSGRTNFTAMVDLLKKEARSKNPSDHCRIILVEKTDRLYRNLKDWVTLDELDLEIHFAKENCVLSPDSRSSEKLIHGIKVLMAKNYIDNLSEETKKGMLEKASQGIYPGHAPFGYLNVECNGKRFIQPDTEAVPLIHNLFEWYSTGNYSLLQVTEKIRAQGLVYRKASNKIHKSIVHKILTNPIYYGEFEWVGKLYKGTHEPLVSRKLFEQVQDVLFVRGQRRTRQQKHQWAFQGLVSCGHCGCALTAEIKKGRYVYYHCTGHKGKCNEKFVREEELAKQFGEALNAIKLDNDVLLWVLKALRESHTDEKKHHDEMIATLQKQYQKLQERIDAMYIDKLDGKVSQDFFDRKSDEWRAEQSDILRKIEKHQNANKSYINEGANLLELAQKAVVLYEKQEMREKRRLLDFVFSNSVWKNGALIPTYRKPFDMLAVTNTTYQKKKAGLSKRADLRPIWLPRQDSNL